MMILLVGCASNDNTPTPAVASPKDGAGLMIHDHAVDGDGNALPSFVGTGGEIVFTSLNETSGSALDGTFTGIIATRAGTSGVFHGAIP